MLTVTFTQEEPDASEAPARDVSWYQRNKEVVTAKSRQKYAENKEAIAAQRRARYQATKHLRKPLTDEQKSQKKAQQAKWYEANKEYAKTKSKAHYNQSKDTSASNRLRAKFGITLADYEKMFREQRGRCAICCKRQVIYDQHGNLRRMAVDHDHKTGRVRQLLCAPCNTGIGLVKENAATLNNMIEYIKKHGECDMLRIEVNFSLDEVQALGALLDVAVKASGIQGARAALPIIDKLEKAVAQANAPQPEVETE
jgi:hypothetical protein